MPSPFPWPLGEISGFANCAPTLAAMQLGELRVNTTQVDRKRKDFCFVGQFLDSFVGGNQDNEEKMKIEVEDAKLFYMI